MFKQVSALSEEGKKEAYIKRIRKKY